MARTLFALAIFAILASAVGAQTAPIDPPIAGRPIDFSNIVGKYELKVSAAPRMCGIGFTCP